MSKLAEILPNEQLKRERQRRGWSRAYVADEIGLADPKTVGRWERGICLPSAHFLQKLCTLFGMLPQELGLYHDPQMAAPEKTNRSTPKVDIASTIRYTSNVSTPLPVSNPAQDLVLDYLKQYLNSIDTQSISSHRGLEGQHAQAPALAVMRSCDIPEYVTDKTDALLVIFLPS